MSVVKINAIAVPPGAGPELEARFAARARSVEQMPGFEDFQLLRPVEGEERYFVYTRWDSEESFQNWVNSAAFTHGHAKAESAEESIEELIVAATMLATQRIGAIIALERQIGLRNYIEGGIPLDAELTYDLLVSIFQHASPLHDGAVIVQDDRVAAAACFLPLTVNPKLSKELGSRHRAAIGLTEENDAIAIVVSEESGRISVVVDGQIERGLNADELKDRLRELVLQRRASTRKRPEAQYT